MIIELSPDADGILNLTNSQRTLLAHRGHSSVAVYSALLRLYELLKTRAVFPAAGSNLPPCPSCGGVEFIPTGNCHACATCGDSQGCS